MVTVGVQCLPELQLGCVAPFVSALWLRPRPPKPSSSSSSPSNLPPPPPPPPPYFPPPPPPPPTITRFHHHLIAPAPPVNYRLVRYPLRNHRDTNEILRGTIAAPPAGRAPQPLSTSLVSRWYLSGYLTIAAPPAGRAPQPQESNIAPTPSH